MTATPLILWGAWVVFGMAGAQSSAASVPTSLPATAETHFDQIRFTDPTTTRVLHVTIAPLLGAAATPELAARVAAELRNGVPAAFARFRASPAGATQPGEEHYYLDLRPLVARSGEYLLWIELFNGENASKPIYSNLEDLPKGPIADSAALIEPAIKRAESLIPLPSPNPFAGQPTNQGQYLVPTSVPATGPAAALPTRWRILPRRPAGPPQVTFEFAPEIGGYSGQFGRAQGELLLTTVDAPGGAKDALAGTLEVPPATVRTGDPDLDENISSDVILDAASFPQARFVLERIDAQNSPFRPQTRTAATLFGTFTLKGISVPLFARALIEPQRDGSGRFGLRLSGSFRLHLEQMQVFPPPGPDPLQHLVFLNFDFGLVPNVGE